MYRKEKVLHAVSWIFFAPNAKSTFMQLALAHRLAEKDPVVVVDLPISVMREHKIPALGKRCKKISNIENFWHYRPLHYPERLSGIGRILRLLNRRRLQQELNQLVPKDKGRIVCFDSPTQDHLVGELREDVSIYLAIDDKTLTVWGQPIHGELEAEKRLLSKVDKAVCVGETLAEVLRSRVPNGRPLSIQVLPNGYDERIFEPKKDYAEPTSIADIPRPRILVAGYVSERIDWEGIIRASQLRPNWHWVFVGPADSDMKEKIASTLCGHGFYHPEIPVGEVPSWIAHSDVCVVPYRLNPFTRCSDPLKAIEYLAMGAPVLSTKIPSLERYRGVIEWVNEGDGESYAKALDKLASQSGSQELRALRQKAVAGDSWGIRANQFKRIAFNVTP
jgi:glycosyltransferase involved in cell wall biosynthesis